MEFLVILLSLFLYCDVCQVSVLCLYYSTIRSVLDPRKCEYLKDYSLDFEHAYMTAYLAS